MALSTLLIASTPILAQASLEVIDRPADQKSIWEETGLSLLVEVICFFTTFAVIRMVFTSHQNRSRHGHKPKKMCDAYETAREGWRRVSARGPASRNDMQVWSYKVFAEDPDSFVGDFVEHLAQHSANPAHRDAINILMEVPVRAGRPDMVEALAKAARDQASIEVDEKRVQQMLAGAFATLGDVDQVEVLLAQERTKATNQRLSMRSLASVVRGFLKSGKLQEAADKLGVMRSEGHEVPSSAVVELVRAACKSGVSTSTVLAWFGLGLALSPEALTVLLCHYAESEDMQAAKEMEKFASEQGIFFSGDAYEALLKLHSKVDDATGVEVLTKMLSADHIPCEGLCRFIIARCADSSNVRLAEALADHLRGRKEMTFATYKTLMKVYAYASLFNKACDLYSEIVAEGMQPDTVMYGSLVKFAVKAGRVALSQELFDKAGGGCVQSYMWLIRAAGQEGDVERALATFRKLQETQPKLVDPMSFNIVIDACASNKDMKRARDLMEEMREMHPLNLVTYNTLMKGYALLNDFMNARKVLTEMEAAGVKPDSASFSCLLSGAAKSGSLSSAWSVVEEMDRRGIAPDSYVVSIMMQVTRKAANPREADRLLTLLDRPTVRICEDEVVFNTVLDACIYCRDRRRVARALDEYPSSNVRPSVRTFGLLIKACSVLGRSQQSWEFWKDMIARGITPNDVTLGCMIDALVEARQVEQALSLFQEWKEKVSCDTIIYSTLIKGFANLGDADRAMALHKDMKTNGVQMNHIVYTALINAHSRNGLMARAEVLLGEMQQEGCQPNAITYSSLVKGHCVRGDLAAALKLFHSMLDMGFAADAVIFNTLLDGCVHTGNWALGDELLTEMSRLKVSPSNYTLSILVKMWSKRGNLDKAFECVRSALRDPKSHGQVDAQVGACIVGACMHNRNPDRALQIFEDMKTWPQFDGPDANTYSALISGLPRHGLTRKAAQIAEEGCTTLAATRYGRDRRPLAPNALQQLYAALRQEGLLEELGVPLADKLRRAGMICDARWLNSA